MTVRLANVPGPIRAQLKPGEPVLWHGKPQDKFDLREVPGIALFMSWVGGVLFGGIGVALLTAGTGAVVLWLFGIIFLATGLYILLGPWLQRLMRRRTFYAITDRRVIIVNERPWHRAAALDLNQLVSARIVMETPDGSGDIELQFSQGAAAYPAFGMENDFEFIADVREVASLLLLTRMEIAARFGPPPSTPWPPGLLGKPAPRVLAVLAILLLYLCAGLYPILITEDLRELSRLGVSAFAPPPAFSEHGIFSPASYFALAPFAMYFFYRRARKFQSKTTVVRYYDVGVFALLAVLGGLLLTSDAGFAFDAGGRTGGFVILSVFALLMARGIPPVRT